MAHLILFSFVFIIIIEVGLSTSRKDQKISCYYNRSSDNPELNELLEKTEREIEALIKFWENSFVDDEEGNSPETPWIGKVSHGSVGGGGAIH